jgi:tetratricopeptide (TPR) repeat protein
MNKIYKSILCVCLLSSCFMVTGCIDETEPTDQATEKQIAASSSATKALLMAMPAYVNAINSSLIDDDHWHFPFGYGAMMHIRDLQTGDMAMATTYSDHFNPWSNDKYMGKDYLFGQYIWNYYYKFVMTTNNLISAIDSAKATSDQLGYLGAGYAYRAMVYLDLARCYEFLPNGVTDPTKDGGNDVTGYTVPIVKEGMSQADARNNPRVKRDVIAAFILSDLDKAEALIPKLTETGKTLPHLDAVYGLKARLYMWLEDYANAQKYARMAIDASSTKPMTQTDCLNTTTGFNDITKWMWGSQMTSGDDAVQTGIINWTSWLCNETTFGYAGAGCYNMIDVNMYNRIKDTDFRKLEWKAPTGGALDGQNVYINKSQGANLPAYTALKFRPNNGDAKNYQTGAASAFPIMRVEEMYFIEAEAAAHQDAAKGLDLLKAFMTTYRDAKYTTTATSQADVIDEIVFQKRVELWGEGLSFFDIKRLDMPVTRGYVGTVFPPLACMNTPRRPAWMNYVIVKSEENNNKALVGWDNPDPSDAYTLWTAGASAKQK